MRILQGQKAESKPGTCPGDQPRMSCNCDIYRDLNEPLTNAGIVLTKNDLYKIRTGRIIREHFHGSNLEQGRITFFISDEKNKVERSFKLAKQVTAIGDGVPIAITKEEMVLLQDGKIIQFVIEKVPPVTVSVMTAQTYHKMMTQQNAATEAKLEESNPHYMRHVQDFLKFARWEIVEAYDKYHNQDGGHNF